MTNEVTDLTQGSITKKLVKYAVPIVVSNVMQALYSLADLYIISIFVGSTGLSAITNGSQIMNLFTNICIGLCNGGCILVGQYYGSREEEKRNLTIGNFFTLCAIIGIAGMIILSSVSKPIMRMMGAPALEQSSSYLRICAFGAVSIMGYNVTTSVMRAVGNSKKPMQIVAVGVITNVILDLLFVGVFKWEEAGAAAATAISQTVTFLLGILFFAKQKSVFKAAKRYFILQKGQVKKILGLGVPSAVQMTVASISFIVVTYLINKCGVEVSAANGISNKIKEFCQIFGSSMAAASGSMIAQNLGAGLYDRAKKTMYQAMMHTLVIAVFLILIVEILAPVLIGIFTSDPAVLEAGVKNLRIEIIGQIFYAVFLIYHAMMIGAGHTKMVLLSSFANCVVFRLVLAIIFFNLWGATGVYLACMIAPTISIPIGYFYVKSNRWKNTLV